MAFISPLLPSRSPRGRRTARISCSAAKTSSNPFVDDSNGSQYLRSLHRQNHSELVGKTHPPRTPASAPPSNKDIWDTLIDDHTPVEHIIHPNPPEPSSEPSLPQTAPARMAARPSDTPKPHFTSQAEGKTTAKRKRGRPKGSKSDKEATMPQPQVSPFMSAVREDLRRRNIAANRDLVTDILDIQSDQPINWDQLHLIAPNGLPNQDGANKDLLQELLPILARQENEEKRVITDEERRAKELIETCYTQFSSIHRSSDRLDNLKPYKLKADAEQKCDTCAGTGMTVCEYCHGQGYVDLGENGEKFNPKFRDNEFIMPRHVMGTTYHCPLCGGLQKERCTTCFGTGTLTGSEQVVAGAARESKDNRAWKIFDMDELIRQEADRIEIGLDGTVIMRAKPRGRPKKTVTEDENDKSPVRRKRRGRPPKNVVKDPASTKKRDDPTELTTVGPGPDLAPDLQGTNADNSVPLAEDDDQSLTTSPGTVSIPRGRPVVRTTDFVNTTDYQFGRKLRRQSPAIGSGSPDSPDISSASSQDGRDRVEEA